jgi:hypothetical protein
LRWLITLTGSKRDIELLSAESLEGLSSDEQEPGQVLLELHDPEGDATPEDANRAAKAEIDTAVRHLNDFGKLRWGRSFGGLSVAGVKSIDPAGGVSQHVFVESAYLHLLPEVADFVERHGHPRPALPAGIEIINALDLAAVTALSRDEPRGRSRTAPRRTDARRRR